MNENLGIFQSHKKVMPTPMNKEAYCQYRGWGKTPENEDPSEKGYLVEYLDGGKPNDERHKGYISWTPKEQFDNGYTKVYGAGDGSVDEKLKEGFYNLYSPHEDEPVLVHGYYCRDMGVKFVFGFNTHDGGGLVLLSDLAEGSKFTAVSVS